MEKTPYKKILCVDFDGVIHSYTSGWQGAAVINDPPVEGAMDWIKMVLQQENYSLCIYSSRSKDPEGINAMRQYLHFHLATHFGYHPEIIARWMDEIAFPTEKPPAYLTIDDRAICFKGTFPSLQEMNTFKAWNK